LKIRVPKWILQKQGLQKPQEQISKQAVPVRRKYIKWKTSPPVSVDPVQAG